MKFVPGKSVGSATAPPCREERRPLAKSSGNFGESRANWSAFPTRRIGKSRVWNIWGGSRRLNLRYAYTEEERFLATLAMTAWRLRKTLRPDRLGRSPSSPG